MNRKGYILLRGTESEELQSRFGCTFGKSLLRSIQKCMRSWVMFRCIALLFGLWNPRRSWWRPLFVLIFLAGDVYFCIQAVTYAFVCPEHNSPLKFYTLDILLCAVNKTQATSSFQDQIMLKFKIGKATGLVYFVLVTAMLLSHFTFFWSVWMLPNRENCVSQENTLTLIKSSEWTKLNCTIGLFVLVLFLNKLWLFIEFLKHLPPNYLVIHIAFCLTQFSSVMTCWIFSTFISSLETLTARCLDHITTSECLDDIIRQHQKLCKVIFGTSNAFKLWFVINWAIYTALCVIWAANVFFYMKLYSKSWCYIINYIIVTATCWYVFISPCFRAAALTGKCKQMLADFNMTTEQDWHSTHPFRNRSQLHLFLKYANYANCGYKVGQLTFGSLSVFFSTLLAVVGIGLKLF